MGPLRLTEVTFPLKATAPEMAEPGLERKILILALRLFHWPSSLHRADSTDPGNPHTHPPHRHRGPTQEVSFWKDGKVHHLEWTLRFFIPLKKRMYYHYHYHYHYY